MIKLGLIPIFYWVLVGVVWYPLRDLLRWLDAADGLVSAIDKVGEYIRLAGGLIIEVGVIVYLLAFILLSPMLFGAWIASHKWFRIAVLVSALVLFVIGSILDFITS
jgi:hypothetical protein